MSAIGFSIAVKDEMARQLPESRCCARAQLSGLIRAAGRITQDADGDLTLSVRTPHGTVARAAYHLVRSVLGLPAHISAKKRRQLDKATFFTVSVAGPGLGEALEAAGIADVTGEPQGGADLRECCRRAFLRGAFMGAGFILDPKRSYHWEVSLQDRPTARLVRRLLAAEGIAAGLVRRRQEYVVYLKDAGGIADWLSFTGAHQALLSLENTRIYKEMKNRVNRLVNCETANLSRTINAGVAQQEAIRYIEAVRGLGWLSPSLQKVARLRLEHPEATLDELGAMLTPPLGKSGVNHRLRQLRQMAEELRVLEQEQAKQRGPRDHEQRVDTPPEG